MHMIEGIHYKKIAGYWLIPYGRRFQTLVDIDRPNGTVIPSGYIWDGATGLPMLRGTKTTYGFILHDYGYAVRDMGFYKTNLESVKAIGIYNPLYASFIFLAYMFMFPTVYYYWLTDHTTMNKALNAILSIVITGANLLGLWWLFTQV